MTYFSLDATTVIYDNMTSKLAADGYSTAIDYYGDLEVKASEIALNVDGLGTGNTITFTLQSYSYANSAWTNTVYKIAVVADGDYVLPIDSRMVPGGKVRLAHDVTLGSGDTVGVHGNIRPRSF